MRMAHAAAETSFAKRLKVGAVAVKNNMVIGTGYNGLPSGIDGSCEDHFVIDQFEEQLVTKPEVRHAEKNLLLNLAKSTESSEGAVVFCTHACCKFCAMDLVDAGITKVYYETDYRSDEGLKYLINNGVEVEKL
jgi:dCMP deaminase